MRSPFKTAKDAVFVTSGHIRGHVASKAVDNQSRSKASLFGLTEVTFDLICSVSGVLLI